ncbi:MAG: SgcJ/EcaC family oxidoreductase [Pseudomonadota bacterium]
MPTVINSRFSHSLFTNVPSIAAACRAFLFALALPASALCLAAPEDEVRATAQLWVEGIGKGDADYMVSLYDKDAILHGTVSPVLRQGPELIREYFQATVANPPSMSFVEPMHIRVFGDTAVNTGNYVTRIGTNDPLTLRYSFVYHKVGDKWLIVDHHSSRMPE